MIRTLLVFCFLVIRLDAGPRRARLRIDGRIVGGSPVSIQEFPYQLSFLYNGRHACGASIIGESYAITAGHCADGVRAKAVSLRAGSSAFQSGGTLHNAAVISTHELFDFFTIDYDVALVRVERAFPLGRAGVAAVPLVSDTPATGARAVASGWGRLAEGSAPSKELHAVQVEVIEHTQCSEAYADMGGVTARMLCAGAPQGGKDACQGDSGGPLMVDGHLVGLVSWGIGCARPDYPGVYTDVASVVDWIMLNMGLETQNITRWSLH